VCSFGVQGRAESEEDRIPDAVLVIRLDIENLTEIDRDDLDHLWGIRLTGTERVWGMLDGAVFSLLWWDPDHLV
jgi:hypothetical protein